MRLIADGDVRPLDVVEAGLTEDGVGPWIIDELFLAARGERLDFPLRLNPSMEFWLRARSPKRFLLERSESDASPSGSVTISREKARGGST